MVLQYIHDHNGNTTGVFIPIQDWNIIKNQLDLKEETKKSAHAIEILDAFQQIKLIKQGKLPKPKLEDFVNELRTL